MRLQAKKCARRRWIHMWRALTVQVGEEKQSVRPRRYVCELDIEVVSHRRDDLFSQPAQGTSGGQGGAHLIPPWKTGTWLRQVAPGVDAAFGIDDRFRSRQDRLGASAHREQ